MDKIKFEDFKVVLADDIDVNYPLEVEFYIDDCETYVVSYMGKMANKATKGYKYWYGLVENGSQAYTYPTFEEFTNAKVFYGKQSLKDLWDKVSITSLNGGTCEEMLPYYINN